MRFPWANTLLLAFILAELVSGFFGLVSGSRDKAIFLQTHRAAGYGIILVLIWKGGNILLSLRWRRAAGLQRLAPPRSPSWRRWRPP